MVISTANFINFFIIVVSINIIFKLFVIIVVITIIFSSQISQLIFQSFFPMISRNAVQIKFPDRDSGKNTVNGDAEENGDTPASPRKCDIIVITGKKEDAETAKNDLLNLIPITEQINIPFDYHRFIIGNKGSNVRRMMDEFNVNIAIPPAKDKSDVVTVIGSKDNLEKAMKALNDKVAEIEAENEDRVCYG